MKYKNFDHYDHTLPPKMGLLLCNLGTPQAPTKAALKVYLKEFLSDPRIVELPRLLWWLVLNLVILKIRPRKSAKSYQSVWTQEGSPLAVYTQKQAESLRQLRKDDIVIDWAMRYGQPSINQALDKMQAQGVEKLLILPLYPQYSATTTASTFDAIAKDFQQRRWLPELHFITSYHDHKAYIDALCESIKDTWRNRDKPQKLVLSYHGIPQRYLHNGDPYHCHCHKTSRLVAQQLQLAPDDYVTTFQSRFGREPWLQPYTDATLKELAQQGVRSVQVICPGFSSDCLETLEEIDDENRDYFLHAGGQDFHYIPALNDQPKHIDAINQIVSPHIDLWLASKKPSNVADTIARAKEHLFNQK